jgi:tetratricopeptide (TPR) repeat protein
MTKKEIARDKAKAVALFRLARKIRKQDPSKKSDDKELLAVRDAMYAKVLSLDPEHFQSLRYSAILAYEQKDFAKALDLYRRAAKVKPNSAFVLYGMAASLYCLDPLRKAPSVEAQEALDKALILDPEFISNWFVEKYASEEAKAKAEKKMRAKKGEKLFLLSAIVSAAGVSHLLNRHSASTKALPEVSREG